MGWLLVLALIGLIIVERQIAAPKDDTLDWQRVPGGIRSVLKALLKAAPGMILILLLLCAWDLFSHQRWVSTVLQVGFLPLAFGREALFFAYGICV